MSFFTLRTSVALAMTAALVAAATSSTARSSAVPAPNAPPQPARTLGIVAGAGGWLTYTDTQAARLHLTQRKVAVISGTRDRSGVCTIASSSSSAPTAAGSAGTFTEEVGYNPLTCQERTLTGRLSAADVGVLSTAPAATKQSKPATAATRVRPATRALAATRNRWAYVKTAWIDPVRITITSVANNLSFPLGDGAGTLVARWNPYHFGHDGWSTGNVTQRFGTVSGGWSSHISASFKNRNFAAMAYALGGVAAWLACGWHLTVTAQFTHETTVYGYRNGSRGRGWQDRASGACSNLVHHAEWDDFGTAG